MYLAEPPSAAPIGEGELGHLRAAYPWLVRRDAMVNHFYFYAFDDDFGPVLLEIRDLLPYRPGCRRRA
ncbi:MAG: hypothetical protein M3P85_01600 [Actinomycetota bacterium]|nr:hypothetical protein [Actinomycetota bacterium]